MFCLLKNGIHLNEAKIQALLDFGLTLTQAKLYLCLIILGTSNAKMLTSCSMVSRQDVYRVLNELFELGLVEKVLDKPIKFRAISIDSCLDLLTNRLNRKTEMAHDAAEIVFDDLRNNSTFSVSKDESSLIVVSGQKQLLQKFQELLDKTDYNLKVCSFSGNSFTVLFEQTSLIRQALKRKLHLQFLTSEPINEIVLEQLLRAFKDENLFKLRFLKGCFLSSFAIFDDKRIILELNSRDVFENLALLTENPSILNLALDYYEQKWISAKSPIPIL